MNFDISHLLDHWDYQPGQVVVRRLVGKDGQEKIQLRLDLGLLQMNAQGRPDGKKPFRLNAGGMPYTCKSNGRVAILESGERVSNISERAQSWGIT